MARKSRYWVKLDRNKRPVEGVLEIRPSRPIGGEWMEIAGAVCCSTKSGTKCPNSNTTTTLTIKNNSEVIATYTFSSVVADTVVASFNSTYPGAGTLSTDGTYYYLTTSLGPNITLVVGCSGTTTTTTTTTAAPSDVRLKSNIQPTGKMVSFQVPEYTWEWNETAKALDLDHYPTTGVLAQELLQVCPEAVSTGDDGYYRVNYGMIQS